MKKKNLGRAIAVALCAATIFTGCGNQANGEVTKESIVQNVVDAAFDTEVSTDLAETTNLVSNAEEVTSTEVSETANASENSEATEESAATEEASEQSTESVAQSEEVEAEYTVTELAEAKTMYATQSLNVRKGPGTEYEKVDILSTNEEVKVIGESGTWYQLEDGNFVFAKYLADTKMVVVATQPTAAPTLELIPELTLEPAPVQEQENVHESDNGVDAAPEDNTDTTTDFVQETTPERAPEVIPEPEPEPTPEPTLEPTPESTPEPTECEHNYEYESTFTMGRPTCAYEYWDNYKCQKCGDRESIVVPPTGQHNYVIEEESGEALCAESRWVMYVCTYCLDRYSEDIYDPNNHVEGGGYYDEFGNCYGCGVHIHEGTCEDHEYASDSSGEWWECKNCLSRYPK